jgi:hypothetical protein
MIGTSIYIHSYIVCFKCFILPGVSYISYWGVFQTKVYKISSCYSARKTIKEKLVHYENLVSLGCVYDCDFVDNKCDFKPNRRI